MRQQRGMLALPKAHKPRRLSTCPARELQLATQLIILCQSSANRVVVCCTQHSRVVTKPSLLLLASTASLLNALQLTHPTPSTHLAQPAPWTQPAAPCWQLPAGVR